MPKRGDKAPAFTLSSTSGKDVSLTGLRGERFVLYFYPRDDTPGCTREACGFRDAMTQVKKSGAKVFGVSKDSLASHARFREKYALPFDLLTDADNTVAKSFDAYGKKKMYGKDVLGTIRSTFLIGADGKIERVWSPVKVDGHVEQVLEALGAGPKPSSARPAAPEKNTKKKTTARRKA